jgi:hypothetical protein
MMMSEKGARPGEWDDSRGEGLGRLPLFIWHKNCSKIKRKLLGRLFVGPFSYHPNEDSREQEMHVHEPKGKAEIRVQSQIPAGKRDTAFSSLLVDKVTALARNTGSSPLLLGTISSDRPTVSNLLEDHPVYQREMWRIIHSEQNRDKPYTRMRVGTRVYLDPETLEITWDDKDVSKATDQSRLRQEFDEPYRQPPLCERPGETRTRASNSSSPLLLGTISSDRPTVSNLLEDHPVYQREMWRIIHSEQNRDKPYTRMAVGTKVYLDSETHEITWRGLTDLQNFEVAGAEQAPASSSDAGKNEAEADAFSAGLVRAVEPYLGSPYNKIDCFQLVVHGLQKLGVRYQGPGGLGEQLVKMAVEKGLPSNAYLNGEGLIEASGSLVYSKSLRNIRDSEGQARQVFREMRPLLRKGLILSFSTPTRGHTGIVSRRHRLWTYINSGHLDHQVGAGRAARGVGEEALKEEIKNWVKLAANRKEPLQITVGRLQERKLRNAMI